MKRQRSAVAESMRIRPEAGELSIHIRAESHNPEDRSFEAVLITDRMTISMDAWTLEACADIVLMDGVSFSDPLNIVDSHVASLFDIVPTSEIRGHVTDIRDEVVDGLNAKVGRLHFDTDRASDDLYQKVVSGSVKNLSAGYTITRGVELSPGESAIISARTFTAPDDKPLLIGTKTLVTEISTVIRGADPTCRIRAAKAAKSKQQERGGHTGPGVTNPSSNGNAKSMNEELRNHLIRCGMDAHSTDEQAEAFCTQLEGEQAAEAKRLRSGQRQTPKPPPTDSNVDAERIRAEERKRVADIEELAGDDIDRALVRRAINEGWDSGRASQAFLQAMRDRRAGNGGVPAGAPAAHVRSSTDGMTLRSLLLSQLMSAGISPDAESLNSSRLRGTLNHRDCGFIVDEARRVRSSGAFSDAYSREVEFAQQLVGAEPYVFASALLQVNGISAPISSRELIRTAFSSGDLSTMLDSIVYARMAVAYETLDDWTRGVVAEDSNSTLNATKRIQFGINGRMVEMPRGGTPNTVQVGEDAPTTYVSRKAASLVIDEIDLIAGSWGDLEGRGAEGLAAMAIDLRADIVAAMLLQAESQKYTVDNAAVVSAGRKNLITSAIMDPTNLEAARALMTTKKFQGRQIRQRPTFLITPEAMWGQANRLLNSTDVRSTAAVTSGATLVPTANSVRAMNLQHLSDGRFDDGVADPADKTGQATVAGDNDRFYLLANQQASPIELTGLKSYSSGAPDIESAPLEGGARGRRITAVSFLSGNWVNPNGIVILRP